MCNDRTATAIASFCCLEHSDVAVDHVGECEAVDPQLSRTGAHPRDSRWILGKAHERLCEGLNISTFDQLASLASND
jgi:hypothetical protein